MWSVNISPDAYKMVSRYIEAYRDIFLERFTDTGIWSEKTICTGYKNMAEQLRIDIVEKLQSHMSHEQVTGFREENESRYIRITMNDRWLEIGYTEDTDKQIRYIESIKIWRKK
jgi:hypothetical protein